MFFVFVLAYVRGGVEKGKTGEPEQKLFFAGVLCARLFGGSY